MTIEGAPANPARPATSLLRERYEVGERLAEGTFFFTHRAQEAHTQRPVAVKVLKPEFARDEQFANRLLAEAQSAARLQHPNIARVLEAWREGGTIVVIVEWVRGINLRERIRRVSPFPPAVAVDIAHAIAEALAYAHDCGYIHGDLRPSNVVITPDGRVKLTDFGVGTSAGASSRVQLSALSDAAGYLAPEVAQGRPPDARSDVYALGCMLHEMLSGTAPFTAETPLATALRHVQDPVPSLREGDPELPPALDGVVRKCLQKDPLARYLTMGALLDDLRRLQEGLREDRPLNWSPLAAAEATPVPPRTASRLRGEEPAAPPRPVRRTPAERPPPPPRYQPEPDAGPSWLLLAGVGLLAVLMLAGSIALAGFLTRTPSEVNVPHLVGKSRAEAVAELERRGLRAEVREEYNARAPEGQVYKMSPDGGTELRAGKPVTLFVSRGAEPVQVPEVVGKKLPDAQAQIRTAGLALGKVQEEYSEIIEKGEVMSQSPSGGAEARKATPVDLTVSKGPQPLPDPPPLDPLAGTSPPEPEIRSPDPVVLPHEDLPARDHEVEVRVPRASSGPQRVRILVRNEDGSEQVAYEGDHQPGETLRHMVTTLGAEGKCEVRVYVNDRLVHRRRL